MVLPLFGNHSKTSNYRSKGKTKMEWIWNRFNRNSLERVQFEFYPNKPIIAIIGYDKTQIQKG